MSAGYKSLWRSFFAEMLFALCLLGLIMTSGCQDGNRDNSVEFGIIADTQYAEKDSLGGRNYRDAILRLEECVVDFNKRKLAFVIQLGDIIDGGDNAAKELKMAASVFKIISGNPDSLSAYVKNIPPGIEAVVLRALSKQLEKRFSSLAEMAAALKNAAQEAGIEPRLPELTLEVA